MCRQQEQLETYLKGGCSKEYQRQTKDHSTSNTVWKYPILYLQQIEICHCQKLIYKGERGGGGRVIYIYMYINTLKIWEPKDHNVKKSKFY